MPIYVLRTLSLDSDGISGELVSVKVGGNFVARAMPSRIRFTPAGRDLLFPRGASLLVYLHYRRICPRSRGNAGRTRREATRHPAKRVSVHPVHAQRINI